MELIRLCVRFREMLAAFIGRELRQRYVGSVLGRAWPFVQPLLILAVYYFVFVELLQLKLVDDENMPYLRSLVGDRGAAAFMPLLMACGLIPWMVSAEFVTRVTNVVLENANLVKKIAFPSQLLPIYLMGSYLVNLAIMFGVFVALTAVLTGGRIWPPMIWLFPIVVLFHAAYLLGIGYFLAAANVFVRDLKDLVPIVTNLWFFLTPIFYMKNIVGADKRWMYDLNPMAYLVDLYRWMFILPEPLRKEAVDGGFRQIETSEVFRTLGIFGVIALVTLTLGYRFFMANRHKFADEI